MKNLTNIILCGLSALLLINTSCMQEEKSGSKAIIPLNSEIEIPVSGSNQVFTIYADGLWEADVTETWLSISPTSGFGTIDVTLAVEENTGTTSREAKLVIKGGSTIAPVEVVITQKGDRFRNETTKTITEVATLEAGSLAKVSESQVIAIADEAFIVTDGTTMLLVLGKAEVKVGSKIAFQGDVITINGITAVKLDEVKSIVEGTYTPGEAKDITNELGYAPGKVEYVKIEAIYTMGGKFQINGVDIAFPYLTSASLSTLANHKVLATGYYVGTIDSYAALHVTDIEDLGEIIVDGVVFEDNFEWFSEIASESSAGDAVGTDDPSAKAPNVWKMTEELSTQFFATFKAKGYKYLYGTIGASEFASGPALEYNAEIGKEGSMYLQKNYLKFGQTQYNAALVLPALSRLVEPTDVVVEFDWCWQVTGSGKFKPDLMTLQVDATAGKFECSNTSTSLEIDSAQSKEDGKSHLEWQHVRLVLKGATAETVLTIRPTNADPHVQNPDRDQNRWYLDNIKITNADGSTPQPGGKQTLAVFPFTYDTGFTGTGEGAGVKWNLSEGWILSEDTKSKMSAHTADGGAQKITYKYEASSDEGLTKDHVRALATGMQKGAYWLFEIPVNDMPAGTYNITYNQSASDTGPNYFLVEVSIDGQNWAPAAAQTTTETYKDGTGGREVTWTYALNKGGVNKANIAHLVNVDYAAPALPGSNTLYVRATIADDMAYVSTKALGTKGTNRIWGPCEITFTE